MQFLSQIIIPCLAAVAGIQMLSYSIRYQAVPENTITYISKLMVEFDKIKKTEQGNLDNSIRRLQTVLENGNGELTSFATQKDDLNKEIESALSKLDTIEAGIVALKKAINAELIASD